VGNQRKGVGLGTADRFLRLPEVIEMTGLGRDSIYRLGRSGHFPRPRKISERASAWLQSEIIDWMHKRPIADDGIE
jgi:prophage regulatory protein